jgi:glutaredoxin
MVIVYSTPTCAPCKVVKARLKAKGIQFEEVDLTTAPDRLADLKHRKGTDIIQTPVLEFEGNLFNISALSGIIQAHE